LSFLGQYEHNLDAKDRLTIPSKFRAALSDGVILLAGLDPCLWIFPAGSYQGFSAEILGGANPLSPDGRKMRRHFFGKADDETLDSAGRIHIPKSLVEHAGLGGPCVVLGMSDYIEVWSAERWPQFEADTKETVNEVAESYAGTLSAQTTTGSEG
jgi:MraZ protein